MDEDRHWNTGTLEQEQREEEKGSDPIPPFGPLGRLTATVDRNGNTRTYAYSLEGLLTTITDAAGLVYTFAHDGNGKVRNETIYGHDSRPRRGRPLLHGRRSAKPCPLPERFS